MKSSITTKLATVLIFYSIILLLGLGVPTFMIIQNGLRSALHSELISTAIEKQSALDSWVKERQMDLVSISKHPHLVKEIHLMIEKLKGPEPEPNAGDDVLIDLNLHVEVDKNLVEMMLLDPISGQVLLSTWPDTIGKYKENQPFFVHGKKEPYYQPIYYSHSTQKPVITISAPIRSSDGQLLAVLAADLNLKEMQAIITRRTGLRQSDDSYLVTTSNLLASQPRLQAAPAVLSRGIHSEAVNLCLQGQNGINESDDYRGVPAIISYRWLAFHNLCLINKIDRAEALAPINAMANAIFVIGSIVFFISLVIILIISRTITEPIQQLVRATEEMGRGNLDIRTKPDSHDEVGKLGEAFNKMAARLKKIMVSRDQLKEEIIVRKRTQEALKNTLVDLERSNKDLEQFAYVASHDLQEPLRMVASYTQLIEKRYAEKLDQDGRDFIKFAVSGANRMQTLINDLLSYSRIGTRANPLIPLDAHVPLGQARLNLNKTIGEASAIITNDELPVVMADETQLTQLFQNLIGNAIKFHKDGESPRIHIAAQQKTGEWVFSVQDNGIGIEAQYLQRIFVIFQRLHAREDYPGTGIGLAICKRIIERHGGKIWVESQPGRGSTFYFTLKGIDARAKKQLKEKK